MQKTTKLNDRVKKPVSKKGLTSEGNIGTGSNLNASEMKTPKKAKAKFELSQEDFDRQRGM